MKALSIVILVILVLGTLGIHIGNYSLREKKDWKAKGLLIMGISLALGISIQYYTNHELAASLRAPRQLGDSGQQARITKRLKPFENYMKMNPHTDAIIASIGVTSATFESAAFGGQLFSILRASGINAIFDPNVNVQSVGLIRGVLIQYTTGNRKGQAFAIALASALKDEGIDASAAGGRYEGLWTHAQAGAEIRAKLAGVRWGCGCCRGQAIGRRPRRSRFSRTLSLPIFGAIV